MAGKKTLKNDIRISLIVIAVIPILILGSISFFGRINNYQNYNQSVIDNSMNMIADSMRQFDANNRAIVRTFSEQALVVDTMAGEEEEEEILALILSYYNAFDSIESIYFGVADGRHYSRKKALVSPDYDPRVRPWYILATENPGDIVMTEPYENAAEPGTYAVAYALAITDEIRDEVIGVVACDVRLPVVEAVVEKVNDQKHLLTVITDDNGIIISSDVESERLKEIEDLRLTEGISAYEIQGNTYEANYLHIVELGWNVVVLLDEAYMIRTKQMMLYNILVIMIAILIISLWMASGLSNRFHKYLDVLLDKIRDIHLDTTGKRITLGPMIPEEVQEIVDTLNLMLERIHTQAEKLTESQNEIQQQYTEIAGLYQQAAAINETLYDTVDKLSISYKETIEVLSNTIEAKDLYTKGHCVRVTHYALKIAEALGYDREQLTILENASVLHDVGKIAIPERVLNKPGSLTDEEFAKVREHSAKGYEITKTVSNLSEASLIILEHHERYDGKGYPLGLAGTDIREGARILCVADAYDAMTSKRSYRLEPFTEVQAIAELKKHAGTQFDARFVEILAKIIIEESEEEKQQLAASIDRI